jgi:hypothetical protein
MWRLASSPISDGERLSIRDMLLTDHGIRWFVFDGFMIRWFDTFGPEAAQATRVALVRQPWSYLRLEAYSFFRLCEGV